MIYSYFKEIAFTAVKRDEQFLTRYVKGVPFVNRRYMLQVKIKSRLKFFTYDDSQIPLSTSPNYP